MKYAQGSIHTFASSLTRNPYSAQDNQDKGYHVKQTRLELEGNGGNAPTHGEGLRTGSLSRNRTSDRTGWWPLLDWGQNVIPRELMSPDKPNFWNSILLQFTIRTILIYFVLNNLNRVTNNQPKFRSVQCCEVERFVYRKQSLSFLLTYSCGRGSYIIKLEVYERHQPRQY